MDMPRRPLGSIRRSKSAVCHWDRGGRSSASRSDAGLEVMRAAREAGINFLDDARYNDETGEAPIPTGYSEVLFGELFRAAGWQRDETIVCQQALVGVLARPSAAEELDGSLGRMGLDHIDVIYANVPPDGLPLEQMVHDVAGLIAAGKARAWAIVNWPADQLLALSTSPRVVRMCRSPSARSSPTASCTARRSRTTTCAPRSRRVAHPSSRPTCSRAACSAASTTSTPRRAGPLAHSTSRCTPPPRSPPVRSRSSPSDSRRLRPRLPSPSRSQNPAVAHVLFGATTPAQIEQNVAALELEARLTAADRAELICDRDVSVSGRRPGRGSGSQPVTMYRTRSPMFTRVITDALVEAGDQRELHGDRQRRSARAAWLSKICSMNSTCSRSRRSSMSSSAAASGTSASAVRVDREAEQQAPPARSSGR